MNNKDYYAQWKEHRRQVPVPDHFTGSVMAAIENQEPGEEYELPPMMADFSDRLMRRAAAAGLLLLGLFRILYIAGNLLRTNPLMPY
jgi:hypothetical protein